MTALYEMQCNWHRMEQRRLALRAILSLARGARLHEDLDMPYDADARERAVRDACWRLTVASHA